MVHQGLGFLPVNGMPVWLTVAHKPLYAISTHLFGFGSQIVVIDAMNPKHVGVLRLFDKPFDFIDKGLVLFRLWLVIEIQDFFYGFWLFIFTVFKLFRLPVHLIDDKMAIEFLSEFSGQFPGVFIVVWVAVRCDE